MTITERCLETIRSVVANSLSGAKETDTGIKWKSGIIESIFTITENDAGSCLVTLETRPISGILDGLGSHAWLLNMNASTGALIVDPASRRVCVAGSVLVAEENFETFRGAVRPLIFSAISNYIWLGSSARHAIANYGGKLSFFAGYSIGQMPALPKSADPSAWAQADFKAAADAATSGEIVENSDSVLKISCDTPTSGKAIVTLDAGKPHDFLGNGLAATIHFPDAHLEEDVVDIATRLNRREATCGAAQPFLGAWAATDESRGGICFQSFFPNLFHGEGLATGIATWLVSRAAGADFS